MTDTTHKGGSKAQNTSVEDVLIAHETRNADNRHPTSIRDCKTLQRDDNKHVTRYGRGVETLKRDCWTSLTPKRNNCLKASIGEYNTHERGGDNTVITANGA